jgi:hypothetical protein
MADLADDVGYWGRSGQVAADDLAMDLIGKVYLTGGKAYFGLRIFAPPFGPPDFMGSAGGLNDNALISGTEFPIKAC